MKLHPPSTSRPNDRDKLTLRTLAHLSQEEEALLNTLASLRQVRAALRHGDGATLNAALADQANAARSAEERGTQRRDLCQEWAAALCIAPASITLTLLADHLSEEASSQLTHFRDRLTQLATEVDEFNRGNAVLVSHCLDFLQQLLVETAGIGDSPRYGPSGTQLAAACGSLIEARG